VPLEDEPPDDEEPAPEDVPLEDPAPEDDDELDAPPLDDEEAPPPPSSPPFAAVCELPEHARRSATPAPSARPAAPGAPLKGAPAPWTSRS
jgi:hypothetical protein